MNKLYFRETKTRDTHRETEGDGEKRDRERLKQIEGDGDKRETNRERRRSNRERGQEGVGLGDNFKSLSQTFHLQRCNQI